MTVIGAAAKVYAGAAQAVKVYAGTELVWPVGGPPAGGFADVVAAAAPALFLRCQETSGTAAADVMGNFPGVFSATAVLGGGSLVPSDPAGKSWQGTGTGSYMNIPGIGNQLGAFAVMVAFKSSTASSTPAIFRDNTSTGGTFLYPNGANLSLRIAGTTYTPAANTLEDQQPHLIMLTRDGAGGAALYLDNGEAPVWTGTKTGQVTLSGSGLWIAKNGTEASGQAHPGHYSEVAVWAGSVPSAAEVADIFQAWAA